MTEERWSLQEVFAPVPVEAWMERVSKDLKGRAVEKLARAVEGGLKIRALYTAEDVRAGGEAWPGEGDRRRGAVGVEVAAVGWEVRQAYVHPEPAEVARRIAEDLGRGVQAPPPPPPPPHQNHTPPPLPVQPHTPKPKIPFLHI